MTCSNVIPIRRCAYCGGLADGNHSIHRDGFGIGPEVHLCDACGSEPYPTCDEIWDRIERQGATVASRAPVTRHTWGTAGGHDVCTACGVRRHGFSGGRTGLLRYYSADGRFIGYRAGPCIQSELLGGG